MFINIVTLHHISPVQGSSYHIDGLPGLVKLTVVQVDLSNVSSIIYRRRLKKCSYSGR